MDLTCTKTRKQITLTDQIASSGEGKVWSCSQQGVLAKIYHDATDNRISKLELMIKDAPQDPNSHKNHISYAWPQSLLENEQGKIVGFLMPEIKNSENLLRVCNPSLRKRKNLEVNWEFLHVTARNVAALIQAIHQKNYVLGDIKLENILVNNRALASIIDIDSFQVKHPYNGNIYRCLVGSEGFTPVELLGKDFSQIEQNEVHDRFRLGVVVYYLLFGHHPFKGKWEGTEECPDPNELIRQGFWPYAPKTLMTISPQTIPLEIVHPEVQKMFLRCFNEGHTNPYARPTAEDWVKALELAINKLQHCGKIDRHRYNSLYGKCYWCERAKLLGTDIFPGNEIKNPAPPPTVTTNKSSKSKKSNVPTNITKYYYYPKIVNSATIKTANKRKSKQPVSSSSTTNKSSKSKKSNVSTNIKKSSSPSKKIVNSATIKTANKRKSKQPVSSYSRSRREFLKLLGNLGIYILFFVILGQMEKPKIRVISSDNTTEFYSTISEAIDMAEPNSTIKISPGTYRERLIIDKPLKIIGDGDREEVIIEHNGCILMKTNSASVRGLTLICLAGKSKNFCVDIPQGQLILDNCGVTSRSLACISIHNSGTNPIIRNCKIYHGNQSGILVYKEGQGLIENCEIYNNGSAGIEIREKVNPTIQNCKIYENKVGIFVHKEGQGIIEFCDIYRNEYSGIEIREKGNPTIGNCKIHRNKSGIFVHKEGQGIIEYCEIYSNRYSGIQISEKGNPTIRNCQIYDGNQSGIFVYEEGQGLVENCEIYSNKLSGIFIKRNGNPTINNCRIYNNSRYAVKIDTTGKGTIKNSDLRDNKKGSLNIKSNFTILKDNITN